MNDRRDDGGGEVAVAAGPIKAKSDYYPEPARLTRELRKAPEIYDALRNAARQVFDSFRLGMGFDPQPLVDAVDAMAESVIRHPEAMMWMRKMDTEHTYLTGHATRTAVLAAVVSRAIGRPERQLRRAALGAALSQIGKSRIPRNLFEKTAALTPEEMARIRKFVELGAETVRSSKLLESNVADIVLCHQERFDGSGYPRGLKGDQIPLSARIAGLVDWYDAATTRKPYTDRVLSATDAMDLLYDMRDRLFQADLVEFFIRAMGIYPTGNLVELSTGEIALVEAQNPGNRTQPLVLIVSNERGEQLSKFRSVDLLEHNRSTEGTPLTIARALGAGENGLDAASIMQRQASQKRGWFFGLG